MNNNKEVVPFVKERNKLNNSNLVGDCGMQHWSESRFGVECGNKDLLAELQNFEKSGSNLHNPSYLGTMLLQTEKSSIEFQNKKMQEKNCITLKIQ